MDDTATQFTTHKGVVYLHDTIKNGHCQASQLSDIAQKRRSNDTIAPWMRKHLPDASFAAFCHCGDYLVFLEDEQREHRKLDMGFFCKQRLCSGCAWRAAVRSAQCVAAIAQALADQGRIMLMVTLTVPNVSGDTLRDTIQHINKSWTRLCKRKRYSAWADNVRKIEITYNRVAGTYHPHMHCVVFVPKGYFGRAYISQQQLLHDWREVTGQPEITQVDVRRCRDRGNTNAILEVAKYSCKASDYAQCEDVCDTMYAALHHTRVMTYAGECKRLRKEYDLGHLEKYEEIDTVRYTMRVVYCWQRIADGWGYVEHDAQPYDMDAAELDRLARDEQRAVAVAMETAARHADWDRWLRTDWVREFARIDDADLEVIE